MHFPSSIYCKKIVSSKPFLYYRISRTHHKLLLLLDQITTLKQFKQIHAHMTTSGLHQNQFFIGKLIEISAIKLHHSRNNHMNYPLLIFTHTQHPNQFAYNTIIRGFSVSHDPLLPSLIIFIRMLKHSVEPDSFTFAFLLKACARSQALEIGKSIRGVVLKTGHESHLFVANTTISFYSACGDLESAQKVFDEMPDRNVVTWNALLSGYVQNGLANDGLRVFHQMWLKGFRSDYVTMIGVISACAQSKELAMGRWAHDYICRYCAEIESNVNVATALIGMYSKWNQMELARRAFDKIQCRDIGAWNALIGGYASNGLFGEAIELFQNLETTGLNPDETTVAITLGACAHLGALEIGKKIHLLVEERRFIVNVTLGTALVDMYSKCGCIKDAREIFDKMSVRDVMTWTSMICGLAFHGYASDSLDLFSLMLDSGQTPDVITFVGVLCACSHAGLVDQGLYYFESMRDEFNISPTIEHYGCIIDLLGRAGRLGQAHKIIQSMDVEPNPIIWRTLLSACKLHLNVELAEMAIENLHKLCSDNCGDYVLLSNIYASKGMWDNVERIRRKMEEGGLRKIPGVSLH